MKKPRKAADVKRAPLPRRLDYTTEFRKSWERYNRAGRHDMHEVQQVMTLIWLGQTLPAQYKDHELTGPWAGSRECHVRGFLLIYQLRPQDVVFVDLGSHAELFE